MEAELHRKLVEEFADVATIIDATGTITYVSPAAADVLGYEPDELVGETGYEYQHPDDRAAVAEATEHLMENPADTKLVETRFRHADGSWVWVEASLQNRMDDPDIDGILVSSRDISDRKQQEQQFRQLAEEYRALLDTVEDSIFFLEVVHSDGEPEFRFERLNRAYEEETGITTAAVRGKRPTEVFGDELGAQLEANYRRCLEAREPIQYQEEVPVETGARHWETNLAPVVTDGEVNRIIGITRNVTEAVRQERRLRKQKEQLEEFASVVSHDLRNPLGVALARAELLELEVDSDHLDILIDSLDRIDALISDTLTLARQGQVVSEMESVSLVNVVGACWKNVSADSASLEIDDRTQVRADRSRLQQIFENLFRNAVEHGGEDVTVYVGRIGDYGFYVEDTGPGVPEADRNKVFEPGHTTADHGTGFGLPIVRRIAEAHGWNVSLTTGTAGGARFEFTDVTLD